jgi:hypothetical protein
MTTETERQPLQVKFGGETYEFDELGLDLDEAETIQKYVGRSLGDWSNGLETCEIKSVMALWWLLRKQSGAPPRSIAAKPPEGFEPLRLWKAWRDATIAEMGRLADAIQAAEEEEAEPDPTLPAPSSPAPAGTPTTTDSGVAALLSQPG